jgi:hypothetical protein
MPLLPTKSGAIISAKAAIERTISSDLEKTCSEPEALVEKIASKDTTISLLIQGYTGFGFRRNARNQVETIKNQMKEAIRSVKTNPEFISKCQVKGKNSEVASDLAILILDTIFTSGKVNIIQQNEKMKNRYNRVKRAKFSLEEVERLKKAEGVKGGTRKRTRKGRGKTYRRRR